MVKLIILVILWMPIIANACIAKLLPDGDNLDQYQSIYTAEVIGVHLVEYEKYRLEALKSGKKHQRWFSDVTLEHEITLLVHKKIIGEQSDKIVVKASGCGIQVPQMHANGIFFQTKKGDIIPIYATEGQYYSELLLKTGRYKALLNRNKNK